VNRTKIKFLAAMTLLGISAAIVSAPAYAQDDMRRRGDIACKSDGNRLCKKFNGQGDMAFLQCFQQNKARLSGKCRKFLTGIGQLY
jgi:hypothetical protein